MNPLAGDTTPWASYPVIGVDTTIVYAEAGEDDRAVRPSVYFLFRRPTLKSAPSRPNRGSRPFAWL